MSTNMSDTVTPFAQKTNLDVKLLVKCKKFVGWSRLIWHNFLKVGDNRIKICSLV